MPYFKLLRRLWQKEYKFKAGLCNLVSPCSKLKLKRIWGTCLSWQSPGMGFKPLYLEIIITVLVANI